METKPSTAKCHRMALPQRGADHFRAKLKAELELSNLMAGLSLHEKQEAAVKDVAAVEEVTKDEEAAVVAPAGGGDLQGSAAEDESRGSDVEPPPKSPVKVLFDYSSLVPRPTAIKVKGAPDPGYMIPVYRAALSPTGRPAARQPPRGPSPRGQPARGQPSSCETGQNPVGQLHNALLRMSRGRPEWKWSIDRDDSGGYNGSLNLFSLNRCVYAGSGRSRSELKNNIAMMALEDLGTINGKQELLVKRVLKSHFGPSVKASFSCNLLPDMSCRVDLCIGSKAFVGSGKNVVEAKMAAKAVLLLSYAH